MPDHPNILVLMTDQQRADAMGCAGNATIRTPNLDALAHSGVRFAQAVTPTPVCVAARMSFITGHRMSRHDWTDNSALPGPLPELPTIMTLLLRAKYWTQGIGKMHFHGRHYGFRNLLTMEECINHWVDDDYLRYLRENGVRTRFPKGIRDLLFFQPQTFGIPVEHHKNTWVADRSIDFLREHTHHRPNQPFFLWSSPGSHRTHPLRPANRTTTCTTPLTCTSRLLPIALWKPCHPIFTAAEDVWMVPTATPTACAACAPFTMASSLMLQWFGQF